MPGNSSPSPKARNTTILFITIVSLILILSYYLFVYVPSHEEQMHEQHIRVLNKIAQNIKAKLGSTINNARHIAAYTIEHPGENDLEDRLNRNAAIFNGNIVFDEHHADSDSAEIHISEQEFGIPTIHISITLEEDSSFHYDFTISAENLVSNLLRFDHFEKFGLFSKSRTLYETHPTGSRVTLDSLINEHQLVSTTHIREIKYGGLPHVAYFRPLRISEHQDWVLVGFISAEKVAGRKYSLSPLFSIILLLLIVVTLFSIPFIKIKIMHVRERLSLMEVVFSILSITFITSILILLALIGYTYWGIDKPAITDELKSLSCSIRGELTREIGRILAPLDSVGIVTGMDGQNLLTAENKIWDDETLASIENLFFIMENGTQYDDKKSISDIPTPVIPIKNRNYFQKARDPGLLCAEGYILSGTPCFYMESIISYNTGKQLAALSLSTGGYSVNKAEDTTVSLPVLALTGRFYSIIKTVLPFGYGFAILDESGNVLFHSDSNRNLQENFFDELDASEQLEAYIYGRESGIVKTAYHDESTLLYVAPVHDWPVSLVTYYDTSLLSLGYMEIYTLYVTLYVLLCIAVALVFLLGFLIEKWSATFQSEAEKRPILRLDRIAPQKKRKRDYAAVMFCYLVLFLVFGAWIAIETAGTAIFISTLLICFQYWILRYFLTDHALHSFWIARLFEWAALAAGTYSIANYISSLDTVAFSIGLSVALVLLLSGWLYHGTARFKSSKDFDASKCLASIFRFLINRLYLDSYNRTLFYASLSFSLLLTCSIYGACYLQETEAVQKYGLVQLSRSVTAHETETVQYFRSLYRGRDDPEAKERLIELAKIRIARQMGIYFGSVEQEDSTGANASPHFFFPHPYQLSTRSKISRAHVFNDLPDSSDDKWSYSDSRLSYRHQYTNSATGDEKELVLTSKRATLYPSDPETLFLLGLVILFLMAGSNSLIKQLVRHLFVLRRPEKYQFKEAEFKVNLDRFRQLLNTEQHLYLVTVPVQFRKILKTLDTVKHRPVAWADIDNGSCDIVQMSKQLSFKTLIITDFDPAGGSTSSKALQALHTVMPHTPVTLISNYDPLDLMKRNKQGEASGNQELVSGHHGLAGLLAEFETYYFPIREDTIREHQAQEQQKEILVKELNIYYELWHSLTPDEQYVLFDLANDGLVNTRNRPIIHRLFKKGLIMDDHNFFYMNYKNGDKYSTSLKIFNERFRTFITNLVETDTLKKLEEEINALGTWHKYRTPLLITLTGILLFVFITQQETYGQVVGLLGSIAASLPLVLKLANALFTGRQAGNP